MSTENSQENPAVVRITISEVLSLLAQGKSRKEIAEHYGRTQTEMKNIVWNHPKLKNRKAKKQYVGIELEDDTADINDSTGLAEVRTAQGQPEVAHTPEPVDEAAPVAQYQDGQMVGSTDTSDWN